MLDYYVNYAPRLACLAVLLMTTSCVEWASDEVPDTPVKRLVIIPDETVELVPDESTAFVAQALDANDKPLNDRYIQVFSASDRVIVEVNGTPERSGTTGSRTVLGEGEIDGVIELTLTTSPSPDTGEESTHLWLVAPVRAESGDFLVEARVDVALPAAESSKEAQ